MKEAIGSANKIKTLVSTLRKKFKPAGVPKELEPLDLLTLGILHRNSTLGDALEGLRRLHDEFVDFNEMRMAPPKDLADVLPRNLDDGRVKSERLTETLNRVYDQGNALDLEHLQEMGKRELKEHLRSALLLDEYGEAFLMNHLFDAPVLPVDDKIVVKLKAEGLLSQEATLAQARELLEEAIAGRARREALDLLSRYAAEPMSAKAKLAARKQAEEEKKEAAAAAAKAAKAEQKAKAKDKPAAKSSARKSKKA